jgi:hypothetical protein
MIFHFKVHNLSAGFFYCMKFEFVGIFFKNCCNTDIFCRKTCKMTNNANPCNAQCDCQPDDDEMNKDLLFCWGELRGLLVAGWHLQIGEK